MSQSDPQGVQAVVDKGGDQDAERVHLGHRSTVSWSPNERLRPFMDAFTVGSIVSVKHVSHTLSPLRCSDKLP